MKATGRAALIRVRATLYIESVRRPAGATRAPAHHHVEPPGYFVVGRAASASERPPVEPRAARADRRDARARSRAQSQHRRLDGRRSRPGGGEAGRDHGARPPDRVQTTYRLSVVRVSVTPLRGSGAPA